ncbi:MAG: alpha/beta fold hydrolase, partial [Mangrovibacterium sp.]|nr:alpha/beta fold hydrolase [Mangrovibacterium sp.]
MDNDLTYITKKLHKGDHDTYVFLFRKYYVPLCSYARRYVGRKDVAEEIVSQKRDFMSGNQMNSFSKRSGLLVAFCFVFFSLKGLAAGAPCADPDAHSDTLKRKAALELILKVLPPDRTSNGRVSFQDETFTDWLTRTGELPPDFDRMPSVPFLPDPLVLDEGGKNISVTTREQWAEKREWMKKQLQYYIAGTFPPAPDNLKAAVLSERTESSVRLRMVELSFGPEHRAKLTVELMIPPGKGPFPVFLTQWNHREWAQVAVRRGYMGCVYAGADAKDDTENYSEIWAGQYDFTRLMRRAYGAARAVDYLYTLAEVDKDKIGITGHSRNGKQSLMAAAFDERITACISSSGGTGAEVPWRYCTQKYDIEDIALLSSAQPAWLHPRLRFFIGREDKLPVDQNLFMALIAPRGLMLSTAINEGASNPWGIEQAYHASKKVYRFLSAENKVAISSRYGLHSICARDMENYLDFFDYVFGRSGYKPESRLFYDYSFEKWLHRSGEKVNMADFPERASGDFLRNNSGKKITSLADWEERKAEIRGKTGWVLGDEPPGVTNPGPGSLDQGGRGENTFGTFLVRPQATPAMGVMAVTPYKGFGDQLFGYLYYPKDEKGDPASKRLPVVIYLHEFDYSKGFNSYHQVEELLRLFVTKGFAVFTFDMLGFGNRIEEGTRFYERYPHWSKLGKMVTDIRGAVDALSNLNFVDRKNVMVSGYSLGAAAGLYAAALDERIAGVVSVAGFTPMRSDTINRGTEGIRAYSHLHGLLPRLGFFAGNESRVPFDFDELLSCIAPRPVLVIAPQFDKDAYLQDIQHCIKNAGEIYGLYGCPDAIELCAPADFNRFSPEMREKITDWFEDGRCEKKLQSCSFQLQAGAQKYLTAKLKTSLNAYSFNSPLMQGEMKLDDLLEYCAANQFDAVDLTAYYFPGYPQVPSDAYLYHIKQKAFRLGLEISGTGVRNDFTDPDPAIRRAGVELVKDWILAAEKLGAPVIRVFSGRADPEGPNRPGILEYLIADLKECT